MGQAIARRIGAGRLLILADYSQALLDTASKQLEDDGYNVKQHTVDVSDATSVKKLAIHAIQAGRIKAVIHTAGLSPVMAPPKRIFDVDLLGTAMVIDTFADALAPGGSMVCIASMAGHACKGKLPSETERHLAEVKLDQLLSHSIMQSSDITSAFAYSLSKFGNHLRVQAAALSYGKRGCRINSISPGVIHTPMAKQELEGPSGQAMREIVEASATERYGTPGDIAAAVAFLTGPESTFITGTDILVDGGYVASQHWGNAKGKSLVN